MARNTTFSEESSGLLSNHLHLHHTITIEITNHLPKTARLEVRERTPVVRKQDDEIKLEIHRVDPPWTPYQQTGHELRGGHQWLLDLPAGAQRTLTASYDVRIPEKKELVGGNRREL